MHRVGPVFPGSVLCPKHWGLKPIDYSHAREFCLGQAINFRFFLCPKVERIFDLVGADDPDEARVEVTLMRPANTGGVRGGGGLGPAEIGQVVGVVEGVDVLALDDEVMMEESGHGAEGGGGRKEEG